MAWYRTFYFVLFRLPMLLISLIFVLIALLSPDQINHILEDVWQHDGFLARFAIFVPLIVAGTFHLVLLSRRTKIKPLPDLLLASTPLTAIAAMIIDATPRSFAICLLALAIGLVMCWWVIRRLSSNELNISPQATGALVLMLWIAATALLIVSPISIPKAIGLSIVTIGLSMIGLALALVLIWPRAVFAYAAICLVVALFGPAQSPVPLVNGEGRTSFHLEEGLRAWLDSRNDMSAYKKAKRPYPVIVTSAEGGGIYAAAHSYMVLSAMQDMCPSFAHHLFAAVGVSGGGVGNLLFRASLPDGETTSLLPCQRPTQPIDLGPLATDFLSPTVANLLIGQFADFLVPYVQIFPDGGQILADAVSMALPGNQRVIEQLGASWDPTSSLPALMFVATDVNRGNRFIMSAIGGEIAHNAEAFPSGGVFSMNDIRSNQAAVVSARFPWMTSTARLLASEDDYRILADGGYFENSGAETVVDLVENIRSIAEPCTNQQRRGEPDNEQCKCPVVVHSSFVKDLTWVGCEQNIYIVFLPIVGLEHGIPGYTYDREASPSQSYAFDPLRTMLTTRTTRGQLALSRARRLLLRDDPDMVQGVNVHGGYFPHEMPIKELNLPLGWKLSSNALSLMRRLVAPTDACGFLPGGEYYDDEMYVADDDKWWEKWMAEHANQAPTEVDTEVDFEQLRKKLDEFRGDQKAIAADSASDSESRSQDTKTDNVEDIVIEGNGCNMLLAAWLFNPEGKKEYYGIPAWGHP